ncbi:LuxR C-terminal-related transcriptional regulator [Thalassobaculum sp.]|uniref:helix-turn-helix transcriptional regulator n=2 Tax=Thalassobaculum sp. TaxID=2022740 RepID=UPI0032ED43B6
MPDVKTMALLESTDRDLGGVRRWAAELCLCEDDAESQVVLARAFADIGFESVAALRRDSGSAATMLWRTMEGLAVGIEDPLTAANQAVLAKLDPKVDRWIIRQTGVVSHEDFLAIDRRTYREFMHLPEDFGHGRWRTVLSVPHRVGDRCLSLGVASVSPFEQRREDIGAARFLAGLYFSLLDGRSPEPGGADRSLGPVQVDILRWAAAGKTYHDIADIVGLTPRTVRYHLDQVRSHYGFATVIQAIVQAAKDFDFDPLLGGR